MKNPSTSAWYYKLRRESKREDLQVLCFNCNLGKSINKGICPHKQINVKLEIKTDNRKIPQFDTRLKIEWPSDEDLIKKCNETSVSNVAKELGVDFGSVSGRLKRRNKYHLINNRFIDWIPDSELVDLCNSTSMKEASLKLNVSYSSLIYKLKKINQHHLIKKLTGGVMKGENNKFSKLNWNLVAEIREKFKSGTNIKKLSLYYKVCESTILNVIKNKTWKL